MPAHEKFTAVNFSERQNGVDLKFVDELAHRHALRTGLPLSVAQRTVMAVSISANPVFDRHGDLSPPCHRQKITRYG